MTTVLHHDDCFNVLPVISKQSIDCIIVDLPYGQTRCKWDSCIDLERMWILLKRIIKPNANIIFFCTTKFGCQLINSNPNWFKYDLIWEKAIAVGFLGAKKHPLRSHEMIYVFNNPSKSFSTYNPQKTEGVPYSYTNKRSTTKLYGDSKERSSCVNKDGKRYPKSVLKYPQVRKYHQTAKPTDLLEWLINSYSNEGDTVLDFTMGAGSCGVACINTKRNFIGIEKEKTFFDIANERINELKK